MAKFKAIEIANFFVGLANSIPGDSIDNLKINKMLYYAQGHSLAKLGEILFSDKIVAWEYGPVVPEVYRAFKCCGRNIIEEPIEQFDERRLTSDELDLLVNVYMNYGKYSGGELVNMTHRAGTPWDIVHEKGKNNEIPTSLMMNEFRAHEKMRDNHDIFAAIPTIKKVPSEWDSAEDTIYG